MGHGFGVNEVGFRCNIWGPSLVVLTATAVGNLRVCPDGTTVPYTVCSTEVTLHHSDPR